MREDQEAEERYQKQQEIMRKRLEDEQRKEKEKQVIGNLFLTIVH